MKLSRALSALLFPSSSQSAKWLPLRTATALQASAVFTAAARKGTGTACDQPQGPEASAQLASPDEKGELRSSPLQAPTEVVGEAGAAPRLPKPSEIPWQAKVANSVHLIGRLGAPIQFGASPDGVYTAVSVLLQEKTHDLPQFRIPIVFQGDLAQIATSNLRENDHVYVTGQLTGGSQFIDNNGATKLEVMVHNISYVLELHREKKCRINNRVLDSTSADLKKSEETVAGYWSDLLENPHSWWDNRKDKLNGKISPKWPDFSHKVSRKGLWLDSAPDWILQKLKDTTVNAEACWQSEAKKISSGLTKKEESWRNLMDNPDKWWDNRSNKSKPSAPDFKHKETGEGLWLDSTTTPKWGLDKFSPTAAENQ